MRLSTKTLTLVLCAMLWAAATQAQTTEHTFTWGAFDHSAWKIQPNSPQGYVIMGSKFFEPANTSLYITGFDEFGQQQWTRTHVAADGFPFSQLDVFWKSFTVTGSPLKYFAVSSGTQGGTHKAYALLLNATGMKFWDRTSPLPQGITFGGVTNATNGGWIATGSSNEGQMAAVKFDAYGNVQWTQTYPVSGFGWSIAQAVGGGYVMAGGHQVVKIDYAGNYEWSTNINLGNAPAPDGSAYSYSEFEEITTLPQSQGFIVTGSAFSNSTSAVYTARLSWSGGVAWSKTMDGQNTGLPGTPVSWINNAVISGGNQIITSWRRGPVSTGGTIYFQRMDFSGNNIGTATSLGNTTPLQEGFMSNAHGKIIVGGTRGGYTGAYAFTRDFLPLTGGSDDRADEQAYSQPNFLSRVNLGPSNFNPNFDFPTTSRVFMSELRVFPNPSTGVVNVGGAVEPGALLRVVSPTGAVVMERQIQAEESLLELDLGTAATGLYTVQVIGKSGTTAKKVMVNR